MDLTTILGIGALVGFAVIGMVTGNIPSSILNMHAVIVVFGGTFIALLINTPSKHLLKAIIEIRVIFFDKTVANPEKIIPTMVELAQECRTKGLSALKEADSNVANGFLNRAATAALEYNDSNFVRHVLEQEVNQKIDEMNEVANVYRTMSILAPMFGLLGTLIGIISVLREISNPELVGPAMAVAITSAFYGIAFANIVCVPIAGKIRAKTWMDVKIKSMILEGVMEIVKGSVPIVVERRLQSYVS